MNTSKTDPDKWRAILNDQKNSGKSIKRFCEDRSLTVSSFYYHKKRLDPKTKKKVSSFIPIQQQQRFGTINILTQGGTKVSLPSNVSPEWLIRVLQSL